MQVEEVDSGVDEVSIQESREGSPANKKDICSLDDTLTAAMSEDDDDLDETLTERLWGLAEMFPNCVRRGTWSFTTGSCSSLGWLFNFSRTALWIFFSSSAILVAPVIFELERVQLEEAQRQQQRQILLGPSAAVSSSGTHGMGMPMPLPPSMTPPSTQQR